MGLEQVSSKPQYNTLLQLVLYGSIGIITNLSGYLFFVLLTHFDVEPKIAMTGLYFLSSIMSYFANWRITFRGSGSFSKSGFRFALIYLLGYVINFLMLLLFVDYLEYSYYVIQALAIPVVALYIFSVCKLFVFSDGYKEIR